MSDIEVVEVTEGAGLLAGAEVVSIASGYETGSGGPPSGAAGGVLAGQYPNPAFAVDMATQAELDSHVGSATPHPAYDDIPSLSLLFANRLV